MEPSSARVLTQTDSQKLLYTCIILAFSMFNAETKREFPISEIKGNNHLKTVYLTSRKYTLLENMLTSLV
jgi:hypothetical protein